MYSIWLFLRYKVTIGDSHRSRNEMSQHTFIVTKIVMHPDYQDDLKVNDIALVKVSSQVDRKSVV